MSLSAVPTELFRIVDRDSNISARSVCSCVPKAAPIVAVRVRWLHTCGGTCRGRPLRCLVEQPSWLREAIAGAGLRAAFRVRRAEMPARGSVGPDGVALRSWLRCWLTRNESRVQKLELHLRTSSQLRQPPAQHNGCALVSAQITCFESATDFLSAAC